MNLKIFSHKYNLHCVYSLAISIIINGFRKQKIVFSTIFIFRRIIFSSSLLFNSPFICLFYRVSHILFWLYKQNMLWKIICNMRWNETGVCECMYKLIYFRVNWFIKTHIHIYIFCINLTSCEFVYTGG